MAAQEEISFQDRPLQIKVEIAKKKKKKNKEQCDAIRIVQSVQVR